MTRKGTIVYVHGASDRAAGVQDHVARIRAALAARGSDMTVLAAAWGDAVGPDLDDVPRSIPHIGRSSRHAIPATSVRGPSRLLQAVAAGIVALQYVNLTAPARLRLWATDVLLHRRAGLMQEILGVADVLVYQRVGEPIREVVRGALASVPDAERPLIALGNSLGGIILVDTLRDPDAPRPDLLVTVGSQAPVLQTFGGLGPDASPPFQPWLNIYDTRDLFAFVAQPVWPDQPGIRDARVDLGLAFPDVHGPAYLSHAAVIDAILEHPALTRP